jgi:hypothetical protein
MTPLPNMQKSSFSKIVDQRLRHDRTQWEGGNNQTLRTNFKIGETWKLPTGNSMWLISPITRLAGLGNYHMQPSTLTPSSAAAQPD